MPKVLVIEDDAQLRRHIVECLTLEDYEALEAADGVEGVEQALQHQPDAVLCDITMPRLDGLGVLLELRANPLTNGIAFIFLTAKTAHEDFRKGMELGADDFIPKPFDCLVMMRAIEAQLAKKALRESQLQAEIRQWQQAFEQEHQQRVFKAKLAAMFSHDFRNPLATILSSNSLLSNYADRMDAARRMTHFNRIEASVYQLLQMLDDMLIVSQMETGSLEFKPQPLDVANFLQRIIEEFQAINNESHQILYSTHFFKPTAADERLLRQIATNLISNAIKYSPQGGEIRVTLEQNGACWELTIEDQGIGIPPEDQKRLFTEFVRGSNVTGISGTGLGLAIVKQAVEVHHGSICLESQVGVGTRITVTIPILS